MSDAPTELARQTRIGLGLMLVCIVVWGVNAVAFKVCTKPAQGAGFDPFFLTGVRFLIVGPLMALGAHLRQPSVLILQRGDWVRYIGFGFAAIVLGEILQPLALNFTSVANLTLLSHGTISLFTAVWALLFLHQRITRAGWVGAAIAGAGVAVVASSGANGFIHFDRATLLGDGIALFRSVEHSAYLLVLGQWLQKRPVLQVTVYNCIFGAAWLLPYVIWRGASFPWADVRLLTWAALAYTIGPTTLFGFVAWNWGMRRVGPVVGTNLFYLMPLTASLAAWWLLGEPISPGKVLGGFVIICGVIILRWDTMVSAGLVRGVDEWRLSEWLRRRRRTEQ